MPTPAVSIRIGTTGSADVKNDFASIATAGDDAANRLSKSMDRAAADAEAAQRRYAAAAEKLAAASATPLQSTINANVDARGAGSAQSSAAAFATALAAQERQAEALRAAIDPLYAAQQRYDAELRTANSLLTQGAISEEEHAAAVALSARTLETAGVATAGFGKQSQLSSVQHMMLQSAVMRTTESVASGMPVWRIAIQQGTEVAAALGMGGAGMGGKLSAVAEFMAGPWGLAIMAGAGVLAVLIPKLLEAGDASEDMAHKQSELAGYLDRTTGKVREQIGALDLLAKHKALAVDIDEQADKYNAARKRTAAVVSDFTEPQSTFSAEGGDLMVTPAQVDAQKKAVIARILAANHDIQSQVTAINAAAARDPGLRSFAKVFEAAGIAQRDAAKPLADTQIELARLAVASGTATDYQRKLVTATTEGASANMTLLDGEAKLMAAHNGLQRAEAELTITKEKAKTALDAGKISQAEYTKQVADAESKVDSARAAQDALSASHRAGAKDARDMAREAAALQDKYDPLGAAARKLTVDMANIAKLGLDPTTRAMYEQGAAADALKAKTRALTPDVTRAINDNPAAFGDDSSAKKAESDQKFSEDRLRDQRDQLALSQAELTLVGRSATEHDKIIEQLKLQQTLAKQYGDDVSQWTPAEREAAAALEAGASALEDNKAKLAQLKADTAEFSQFTGQELDKVFDPQNWKNFGDLGKSILQDLEQEFIKLALLNPLKNALGLGGSGGGSLPSLFGGGGGGGGLFSFLGFDSGTEYSPGGMAWVGENGRELVDLPRGSKVHTASDSRRLLSAQNDNMTTHYYDLRGAVVYEDLMKKLEMRSQQAEARGAQGGARMAQEAISKKRRSALGRGRY